MSDTTPSEPTPEVPTPPVEPVAAATPAPEPAPSPYAAPAAPAAPAYAAAPAGPAVKQGLSLASFIVGLAAFVFSWVWGIGFVPGIVAVILGFMARKREPQAPRWMWLIGIIAGFVAIFVSLIFGIITIIGIIAYASLYNQYGSY